MTKFLLISEDSEKERIVRETFPSDEVILSVDEMMIFDTLKVEEPEIVIIDNELTSLEIKALCRKIKQFPVIILLIVGESIPNKDITHNINLFISSPLDKKLLAATVDSSIRTRQSLIKMTLWNL